MPKRKAASPPLVYVDSCVYLDLVMRNRDPHADTGEERWRSAKVVFDAVNSDEIVLASSALVEAEVCCNGDARSGKQRVRDLLTGWFTAPSTAWVEIDRYLAREAVRLTDIWQGRGEKRLGSADALHLAAALRLGADFFMTHDRGFPLGQRVDGMNVMRPDVVWQESLWNDAAV